jgi:restriction system protein
MTREQVTKVVAAARPGKKEKVAGEAGMLYRFANEIGIGDIMVTPDGGTRELLFGEVTGPYEYQEPPKVSDFPHARTVNWLARRSRDELPKKLLYSLGSLLTVFKPSGQDNLVALLRGEASSTDVSDDFSDESGMGEDLFADLQSRSEELIKSKLAGLDGFEMQDVVAGILRAMGYHARVSPPGADGGVDVVASRDPLAVEQPVKVQVKAKPNTKSTPDEIRALNGVLGQTERGIFVSSGGFTKDALNEPATARIVLVDGERLQSLLVEYYDRLDQDTKSLVPLRRLYFPSD